MADLPQNEKRRHHLPARSERIGVVGCQFPQNATTEIIPMMVASTNPTSTGCTLGGAAQATSETLSGSSVSVKASLAGVCVMAAMIGRSGKEKNMYRCEQ
jgi:hypothetical protein